MSLQELINHPMPVYSKKEEKFNTVSHFIGIILGTFFLFFGLYISLINKLKPIELFSVIVFSLSVIMLYSMSTIYHGLNKNKLSKRIMRIVDHCTIYLLIAGTYTPICIISLFCSIEGVILLIFEWVCAIIGIIINAIALNKKNNRNYFYDIVFNFRMDDSFLSKFHRITTKQIFFLCLIRRNYLYNWFCFIWYRCKEKVVP